MADKKTEVSSDVAWTDVSPASYHAVENNLGMAIAHKDAGLYDSEAQGTAQPPGFAYIAPPSVGSNQYGYWTNNEHGSFWTFLPEYLIMRELLWGHSYRPIYVNEYNGYSSALRSGRTYYGRETPASPPRYGSHGTETEQRYAGSRYVQSGKATGRAPRQAPPSSSPRFSPAPEGSEGHRFGRSSNRPLWESALAREEAFPAPLRQAGGLAAGIEGRRQHSGRKNSAVPLPPSARSLQRSTDASRRSGRAEKQSPLFGQRRRFRIQVVEHFHVVGQKSDRHNDQFLALVFRM